MTTTIYNDDCIVAMRGMDGRTLGVSVFMTNRWRHWMWELIGDPLARIQTEGMGDENGES